MGAWGAGSFENDDAADWVADLLAVTDASEIEKALDQILNREPGAYIDLPEANNAIAAAEVVAAAIEAPSDSLPADVAGWVKGHGASISAEIYRKAYEAVGIVAVDSEANDLWSESESVEEWRSAIVDLQKRLATGI
jgi:hypothetical protein